MILWWVGNALLALVALPIVLVQAFRIIRSLSAVRTAARDIAGSVQSVAGTVPPVMATLGGITSRAEQLSRAT